MFASDNLSRAVVFGYSRVEMHAGRKKLICHVVARVCYNQRWFTSLIHNVYSTFNLNLCCSVKKINTFNNIIILKLIKNPIKFLKNIYLSFLFQLFPQKIFYPCVFHFLTFY